MGSNSRRRKRVISGLRVGEIELFRRLGFFGFFFRVGSFVCGGLGFLSCELLILFFFSFDRDV